MSTGLFRKEVVLAQRGEWLGSIRIQPPRLGWIFLGVSVFAITMILILLFFTHYTRHERFPGGLVSNSGLQIHASSAAGIVTHVFVQEGEMVRAGQMLLQISSNSANTLEDKNPALLRATTEGTVVNVLATPGQAVAAQQTLVTTSPNNTVLSAELWVPSEMVGFIRRGEVVMISYHSFPYQEFGLYPGVVSNVSQSATSPREVSQLLGQNITDPRYRVVVSLDSQYVHASGHEESIRQGMTLDADIMFDRRRLIEWVVQPLNGIKPLSRNDISNSTNSH